MSIQLMNGDDFDEALDRLGMTPSQFAKFVGAGRRSAYRWREEQGPTNAISRLLQAMVLLEDVLGEKRLVTYGGVEGYIDAQAHLRGLDRSEKPPFRNRRRVKVRGEGVIEELPRGQSTE
jgi:hypothetical protein